MVSRAIKRRAGSAPFRELSRKGPIPLGLATETSAGRLRYRAIIHVAGMNLFFRSSERAIRSCVRNALAIADARDYGSIALPVIGAGTRGMSHERALRIIKEEAELSRYGGEVRIVRYR